MSTLFTSQKGWKNVSRRLASALLAFLLVFQAFGPGLFAIQEVIAATNVFSETFGNGNDLANIPDWDEHEEGTIAKKATESGEDTVSPNGGRFAKIAEDSGDAGSQDGWICRQINAQDKTGLQLSYYWRGDAQAEEEGDNGIVEYNTGEGECNEEGGWAQLKSHNLNSDSTWTNQGLFDLPESLDETSFRLRFRNQSSADDEHFRVDGVVVSGDEIKKINICHLTASENNPWEAIRINESAWDGGPDHEGHGDYLYNGPVNPQNQQPTKPDGDIWCGENDPTEPEIELSKTAQYDGNHRVTYTINWSVKENDVDNLTITDTLPAWTDLAVNTMVPSTTPPLLPGSRNFHPSNPTQDREVVWNLGAKEEGSQGTITFRVELWTEKTCEIAKNKAHAHAMFGEESITKDAYSDMVKVNSPRCDDTPPPPDRDNSCMIPNNLGDDEEFVLGEAPLAEKDLAQIFAESVPVLSIDPENDQVNTQVWDIDPNAADAKFAVKLVGKQAANNQVFGWYKKGVPGSFTGIFRVGDPLNGSYDSLPELSITDPAIPVTIPASNGSVGFAIVSDNGSADEVFFSEKALNTNDGGKDHVAVYNPGNNRYVVAFEDLLSGSWGQEVEPDYNDLVVKIVDVRCTPKQLVCEPGVELLANGSFEKPVVTHSAGWNIYPNGATELGWGVEWLLPSSTQFNSVFIPDTANLELHKGGSVNPLWLADEGAQYAELDTDWGGPDSALSGEPASARIYQDIPTVPGKEYVVKFAFAPRPGTGTQDNMLSVLWGGTSATGTISRDGSSETTNIWKDYVVKVTATSTMTRVAFADAGLNSSNSLGVFLDNASVQCAPDCNPTLGSVVSDEDTKITLVNIDGATSTPNTNSVPVSVVSAIQALDGPGGSVWEANVGDANAKWIWSEDPYDANWTVDKWVTFTRTFNVVGTPESGSLKIAADNEYEVWVNGQPGIPPMVDASEDNHSSADTWDVTSLLVDGSNTLEIRVKNLARPNLSKENNPGGLLFNLSWTAKDCGNDDPQDETSRVIVKKYINGEPANSQSSEGNQFGIDYVTSAGSGNATLNSGNNFVWESPELIDFQSTAQVAERTNATEPADALVIPIGGQCQPGKFRLNGYSVGSSFANAEGNATSSSVMINVQDTNVYVIVWNEKCPDAPTVNLSKSASYATSTGEITFTIDWAVSNGNVSNLVITDPIPAGLSFVSATLGGEVLTTPGTVTWNLGAQTSGSSGSVSFIASLDAWNANLKWASGSEQNNQAKRKNGTNILSDRTDPTKMFGAPQSAGNPYDTVVPNSFFSLGFDNGSIVVTFGGTIFNGPGNDVKVYEITGGTTYPDEKVKVEAWNGIGWTILGTVTRDQAVDLGSLATTSKIRLTEDSNKTLFEQEADGYDVDAVEALNILPNVCDVKNTAYAVASYGQEGTLNKSASTTLSVNADTCEKPPVDCDSDCDGGPTKGTLTIIKNVINDNLVGTATSTDFTFTIAGTNPSQGSVQGSSTGITITLDPGTYSVTENDSLGYNVSYSTECSGTMGAGESKTCTVTNDDFIGVSDCTDGCGGDGGGGGGSSTNTTGQSRRSGGGSSGGSLVPSSSEVAGAFTELPGLPDTGNAPIAEPQTSAVNAVAIILSGIIALLALNYISFRVLKLQK